MRRVFIKTSSIRILLVLCMALGCTISMRAQTSLGQIAGTISDSTGSVLPGATVIVTNPSTQSTHTVTSDPSGFFVVTNPYAAQSHRREWRR